MYSYGPPHMAVQKKDGQQEHTFSSSVRIRDVVLKTCLGRWTIGRSGERGSGISVLPARHDDDDDIKGRINKTQQNSRCGLCWDRDETTNHVISECSKLVQKVYKTKHNWVGIVIHWELCKKLKSDHTSKYYQHKPACPGEWDAQTSLRFWETNGSPNLS